MGKNRQLTINLITTLFVLIINIIINFGLSRYIVDAIGESAYGFVSLANTFVSYATIFTTALNSMASRFITIDIHNNKLKSASEFFSSVLIANCIIIGVLIIPSIFIIWYLENLVNIPVEILVDVKILFSIIFVNFFVGLIGGVFTIATYCKNKLYLSSLRNMESSIIKVLVIVGLFVLFKPATFYIGIATLIASIYILLFNIKYTKELLPGIKIKKKNFSLKKIKILLSSGLWNSITNLGNVLADGLDLLISNLAIDATTMGLVAIAKVPSNVINTVISSLSTVFQPQTIEYYAKGDIENVKNETIKSMKISGIFGNIPFCYIVIFATAFCSVWMPNVALKTLSILCIITFINVFSGGLITPLYNIFTITNHVKGNALLNIGSGLISTIIVLVLLSTTNLGVYAIVGVSSIVGVLKGFIIVPCYSAKCIGIKYNSFFKTIYKYFISSVLMIVVFYIISIIMPINNWIMIFISIVVCGVVGLIINIIIMLEKEDRKLFIELLKNKLNINR